MIGNAATLFKRHFGFLPPRAVSVPGQAALLGWEEQNGAGLALTAALGRYVHIAAAPRTDGRIELFHSDAAASNAFWLSDLKSNAAAPWADGVKNVLAELRRRGVHFSGFNAAVATEFPPGSCLGGDAALVLATALIVRQLYPFALTETGLSQPPPRNAKGELPALTPPQKRALARLCQGAARSRDPSAGLLGPLSALFGKAWHLLNIDFHSLTVEYAPLLGYVLVLCEVETPGESGAEASPEAAPSTSGELDRNRRSACASAVAKLGVPTLRSLDAKFLAANQARLTAVEYACARHVIGEARRVVAAEAALREGDVRQFGEYLFQSSKSASEAFCSGSPTLDPLIQLARALPGCAGARRVESGARPATLNLVEYHQAERFMTEISRQYSNGTDAKLLATACQIVGEPV